jgi:uncharacterized membrane protein YeiB
LSSGVVTLDKNEELKAEDILKDTYKDVTEWLKFAEAKNAALLTFNGAIVFGLLRLMSSNQEILLSLNKALYFSIFILSINMLILLSSFLPALNQSKKQYPRFSNENSDKLNLLYYRDLSNLSTDAYLNLLKENYMINNELLNQHYKDLATQITTLSSIAMKKYKLFIICAYITLLSIVIIILEATIHYII